MKKSLLLITFLICAIVSFAQIGFPNNQFISSPQTYYHTKGGLGADSGVVITTFPDTATANYGTYIKNTHGITIRVQDTIYFRDVFTSRWVKIAGSNGSTPGCLSGKVSGNVVYDSLLVFHSTIMNYFIGCRNFTAPASNFTLPVTAYLRVDVWVVDTLGTIRVEQGGISGLAYQYNPASELEVARVTIDANATTPTGISNLSIYKENVHPPEWTGATVMAGVNFAYPTNPFLGDSSTYIPSFTNGNIIEWQDLINTYDINDFTFIKFYVRLGSAMTSGAMNITFYNGAVATTNTITILNGQYGFNSSIVGSYQLVAIPISAFLTIFPYQFNLFQIQFTGTGGPLQFDNIVLQSGGGSTSITGVQTWSGANGDVRSGNVVFKIGDDIWSFRSAELNFDSTYMKFRNSAGLLADDSLWLPHDLIFAGTNMNIRDTLVGFVHGHIFDATGGGVDQAFNWSVRDSLNAPPTLPPNGSIFLVGTAATGAFTGEENHIATYDSLTDSYTFQTAVSGDLLFNSKTTFVSQLISGAWVRISKANLHQGGDSYATNIIYGSQDANGAAIKTNDSIRVQVSAISGNVGIGPFPLAGYKLAVDGAIYSAGAGQISYWLPNGNSIRGAGSGSGTTFNIDGNTGLGGLISVRAENIRLAGSVLTSGVNFRSDTWVDADKSFGYRISNIDLLTTKFDSTILRVNDNSTIRKIGTRAANNLMFDNNGAVVLQNEPATSALLELRSTERGLLIPRMTAAQRLAMVLTGVSSGVAVAGSGYTNGGYPATALTGGSGSGATAKIIVSGGIVSSVSIVNPGTGYAIGNVLGSASIGGGSGFTYTVNGLSGPAGMIVFDTDSASTFQLSSGSTWQNLYNTGGGGGSVTASNGLTLVGSDVQLGGALTASPTITAGASNLLTVTGSGSGAPMTIANSSSGRALNITSSTGDLINAQTNSSSTAVNLINTGSGRGMDIITTGGEPLHLQAAPSSTNTVFKMLDVTRQSSGTVANGIGGSIDFLNGTTTATNALSNQLISKWVDATGTAAYANFIVTGTSNNITSDWLRLDGTYGYLGTDTIATRAYARSISGVGTTLYSGDGTILTNRNVALNGKTLSFNQGVSDYLTLDPVTFSSRLLPTDGTAISGLISSGDLVGNAVFNNLASSDGTTLVNIYEDAQANTISHTANKHQFNGIVQITDGTEGASKVFTSDGSGNGSWQTPAAGGGLADTTYFWSKTGNVAASGSTFLGTLTPTSLRIRTANVQRMIVDSVGFVGIGDPSPVSMFTVGSGDLFQVNSSGNPVKVNNVTTSFPSSQGAAYSFLKNDGSGNLTWLDSSDVSFLSRQRAAATYAPISTTVTGGVINWPGTIYTTPTTGTVSTGTLTFAPALASQSALTVLAAKTATTPSFQVLDSAFIAGIHTQPYNDLRYAPISGGAYVSSTGTTGDVNSYSATNTPSRIAAVATGSLFASAGTGTLPVWSASPTLTTSLTVPTINGSVASGGTLTLVSTTNGTKGKILFGTSAYDEVNNRLGIGQTTPTAVLHLKAGTASASTAPIKLTAGTRNTTPEAGTIEYETGKFILQTDALELSAYNTSGPTIRTGDFTFQPITASNGFITNNATYNGTNFVSFKTGYGAGFQMFNGQLLSFAMNTVSAGATQTKVTPLKVDYLGNVAIGGDISSTLSTFTGANMLVTAAGNVGIGQLTPTAVLHLKAGVAAASGAPQKYTIAGAIINTTAERGAVEVASNRLYYTDSTATRYIIHAGGTPTIAAGVGAGTSPTISITGIDEDGYISVTTGTLPTLSGTVATITFSSAYGATPKCVLISPANSNSSLLSGVSSVFVDQAGITTTTWAITAGTTALTAATAYQFYYRVMQ